MADIQVTVNFDPSKDIELIQEAEKVLVHSLEEKGFLLHTTSKTPDRAILNFSRRAK